MKTTHEVLVAARNIIADPEQWSQGDDASFPRDKLCPVLVLLRVTDYPKRRSAYVNARDEFVATIGEDCIPRWNDTPGRTHAEVLAAFDKAIAATAPEPDTSFLSEALEPAAA